ncbi:MAG: RDD family protein [Clostridia bacterium]|nr:RDD family protein [Clostridia bacterium]
MRFELQRADFWKRISAFLFDAVMIVIVSVGLAAIFSLFLSYGDHYDVLSEAEREYSEKYGIDLNLSPEEYEKLSEEEKQKYEAADAEFAKDEKVIYAYNMLLNLSLITLTMSLLLAFIGLELVVPILFKHGRTLGKKIFGLAVMRTNGVKLGGQAHFIRSIIGKYTMETMVPIYILLMILFGNLGVVGTVLLILILLLEIFTMCYTKTRSTIHDLISDTVVVDYQSQMIFESEDELIAYKTRIHEEEVNKKEY